MNNEQKLLVAIEGLKQITYAGPEKSVKIATNILAAIGTSEPVCKVAAPTDYDLGNLLARYVAAAPGEYTKIARANINACIESKLAEAREEWMKWHSEDMEKLTSGWNETNRVRNNYIQALQQRAEKSEANLVQVNKWRRDALEVYKVLGDMWAEKVEKLEAALAARSASVN